MRRKLFRLAAGVLAVLCALAATPIRLGLAADADARVRRVVPAAKEPPRPPPLGVIREPAGRFVSFSRDGTRLLVAGADEAVLFEGDSLQPVGRSMPHGAPITFASVAADGRAVLTAGGKVARVWDARTGKQRATLEHGSAVVSAAISAGGAVVVTADEGDKRAFAWDALTGKRLAEFPHETPVRFVAVTDGGGKALTVSAAPQSAAHLWNVRTGLEVAPNETLSADADTRRPAALSANGGKIATNNWNWVYVWRGDNGKAVASAGAIDREVSAVAISPDGTRFATATGGYLRVWDAATGKPLTEKLGWPFGFVDVAFSADGRRLLTTGQSKAAAVWDVATGRKLLSLQGEHPQDTPAVAFSGDGRKVAATDPSDGSTRVWDVPEVTKAGER